MAKTYIFKAMHDVCGCAVCRKTYEMGVEIPTSDYVNLVPNTRKIEKTAICYGSLKAFGIKICTGETKKIRITIEEV